MPRKPWWCSASTSTTLPTTGRDRRRRPNAAPCSHSSTDKPAAACLASRVPYGTPVTLSVLTEVAAAESALRRLGFRQLRVRHYGDLARLELPVDELDDALARRIDIVEAVRSAGYRYVTLDLEGFRSGNLNG
jgi:pyridinium-3,5-biscarboxylic acid mononucleotide sulfurtransferase